MNHTYKLCYFFYFALLGCFFISCTKQKIQIPPGVLNKQEMVPVIADVHLAQAAAGLYHPNDSTRFSMKEYLPYILKIHHVTEAQYDTSISFYMANPELMQEIYDSVIVELSKKESEVTRH